MKTIRTIRQAAAEYKEADPRTPISESLLRRMITAGTLPYTKTGTKYLLDMDTLGRVLSGEFLPAPAPAPVVSRGYVQNNVRRISEARR